MPEKEWNRDPEVLPPVTLLEVQCTACGRRHWIPPCEDCQAARERTGRYQAEIPPTSKAKPCKVASKPPASRKPAPSRKKVASASI